MSKIFYDHLIIFVDLHSKVKEIAEIEEERHELYKIIDEIIHHRVLGCILDVLPKDHHREFVERFHQEPHNDELLSYLNEKTPEEIDIENHIKSDIKKLEEELLEELSDL
jgi:hypothetical protein